MNQQEIRKDLLRAAVNLSLFFGVLLFGVLLLAFRDWTIAPKYSSMVACSVLIKGLLAGQFNYKFQQQGKLIIVKLKVPAIIISCVFSMIADRILSFLFTSKGLPNFNTNEGIGDWLAHTSQVIIVYTMIVYLFKNRIHEKEKTNIQLEHERIKTARAKAESLLLKQQIQPHFLFNSLNTLKILYNTDINKADQYLENLAAFLRSSIAEHEKDVALIQEEMKLVDSYMKMQQIRFGESIQYHIDISNETYKHYLPSFTLQPLVENAIKHNSAVPNSPLHISIIEHGGRLIVTNNIQPRFIHEATSGMGLNNLAARYRLLVKDEIIVKNENQLFSVSVKYYRMKILIIEDEQLAAVHLKNVLKSLSEDIEVCQTIASVKEAVAWFGDNTLPDLIFCNIELADGSAFAIFEQVKIETPVIFCTAYNEFAMQAFKTSGIDYILKPFTTADISAALEKYYSLRRNLTPVNNPSYDQLIAVLNAHGLKRSTTLLVNFKEKVIPVQLDEIAIIYLADKLVRLITISGRSYLAGKSLDEIEKMTGADWFRVNRQFLVHRQAIEDVSYLLGRRLALNLTISFEERITISREKAPQFLQWLGEAT